jgi:hypothetical protein
VAADLSLFVMMLFIERYGAIELFNICRMILRGALHRNP